MFESLASRLGSVFDRLTRRGALSESDVGEALREIRVALLEADVALPVVRDFIEKVREKAVGQEVVRSVTPGQMVVKIVHDHLVEMLGAATEEINLEAPAPVVVLMVGLQGSGKTTTTGKIALRLKTRERKRVLMASLDVARPAAQRQLAILGEQASVPTLPIVTGEPPLAIARRALQTARLEGYDVLMLDTAGRLHIDDALMAEVAAVRDATQPTETLLVVDAMTGRILGMGDVVSLVEKATETIEREEAEKLAAKVQKGEFDLDDLLSQLRQLKKMGGMSGLLGMLPGVAKVKKQMADAKIDESMVKRQEAIILSMTRVERRKPDIIKASRKQRIAAGSGTSVQDVNRLLKQYDQMRTMMKQVSKLGAKGMMRGGLPGMGLGPGMMPPRGFDPSRFGRR